MHWEYWPFQLVYIPIYFQWGYYALKAKSLFFFNSCNPSMRNGGFFMDSKKQIYDLIPPQYYPTTRFIRCQTPMAQIEMELKQSGIKFPLIAKPDIGLRGSAVKKINTLAELEHYATKANFNFIIQDVIPYPNEVGIFYVRYPHEIKGRVTGIVAKEFLAVKGDGMATICQLIHANPRYALQYKALHKEYGSYLETVLPKGEILNLVPYGNHARGAKFLDFSYLIDDELTATIDAVCKQINGFYFGRLDVMYSRWELLKKGEEFAIVELNGAASEPTHIYDPSHSIFFAWKELARHIKYMFEISMQNNRHGHAFLSYYRGMRQYRLHKLHTKKIVNF